MPITKSAKQQVRVDARRTQRNKGVRSQCRTLVARAGRLIAAGELDEGQIAVVAAVSALDKAAQKGIIHTNNASRRKARLTKKLSDARVAASS